MRHKDISADKLLKFIQDNIHALDNNGKWDLLVTMVRNLHIPYSKYRWAIVKADLDALPKIGPKKDKPRG